MGSLPTLALLVVDGFVGAALTQVRGSRSLLPFNEALAMGACQQPRHSTGR